MKRIQISDNKDLAMGKIVLGAEAIMLKGAVVTAMAQKVTLKEDTFVYNSSAYRTPEGSVVEELVKRLPGAEVSDDGTIKVATKETKDILLGKYGQTVKPVNPAVVDQVLGDDKKNAITCRPADLLEPELDKIEAEMKQWKQQDEDVLSYALFE